MSRIFLIFTEYPPRIGGMQSHAIHIARYLSRDFPDLILYTYQPWNEEEKNWALKNDSQEPYKIKRILSRIAIQKNIRILKSEIQNQRPQLIFASTVYYGLCKNICNIPVIARSAGNDVQRPWIAYPFHIGSGLLGHPFLENPLYSLYNRLNMPDFLENWFRQKRDQILKCSLEKLDHILANSTYTKEILIHSGINKEKITVVSGGVDIYKFSNGISTNKEEIHSTYHLPTGKKNILFAGRLVKKKGISLLLDALVSLNGEINWHCIIAGEGPLLEELKFKVDNLGIQNSVSFIGKIPHTDIQNIFSISDLMVLPSLNYVHPKRGTRDTETMGRVICEANAAGVPVLASDSGGIPDIVRNGVNGLLFESGNHFDLKEKITLVLTSAKVRETIIKNGFLRARKEFSWDVVGKKTTDIIKKYL